MIRRAPVLLVMVLLLLLGLAACQDNPLEAYAWRLTGGDHPDRAAAPVP